MANLSPVSLLVHNLKNRIRLYLEEEMEWNMEQDMQPNMDEKSKEVQTRNG